MEESINLKIIGHLHSDFPEKFGIPRQSGLVEELRSKIIFLPKYRTADAFRGLEGYSHIWILWQFSKSEDKQAVTVRPPRLGGNRRMGVFATRSPYRPNPIGLSAVKLEKIEYTEKYGPVLYVLGADILDGTPIIDIKPYLPYTDSRPDAAGGFAHEKLDYKLKVVFENGCDKKVPEQHLTALIKVLQQDPRPSYQNDPSRIYGMDFAGFKIKFRVEEDTLTVVNISL